MKYIIDYEREDEKTHSVRFAEVGISSSGNTSEVLPKKVLGTIYVAKESGLTKAKKLRITIEEVE